MRQHRTEKALLRERIRQLEARLRAEMLKSDDVEKRLKRVVKATAEREYGPRDIVRLCVNVDRHDADINGNGVYEDAIRQLMNMLRSELSSR